MWGQDSPLQKDADSASALLYVDPDAFFLQVAVSILMLICLESARLSSSTLNTYSLKHLKRVFPQRVSDSASALAPVESDAFSLQAAVSTLMLISLMSATLSSLTLSTYSHKHPKRVFLQHLTRDSPTGSQSVYAAGSSDATDITIALKQLQLTELESHGNEWLVRTCCYMCFCAVCVVLCIARNAVVSVLHAHRMLGLLVVAIKSLAST